MAKWTYIEGDAIFTDAGWDQIYNMLPEHVSVIVAKACYHDKKWISVLSLPDGTPFFTNHEKKAILLGVKLRTELNLNIPIVNDNRDAVKELKELYPDIQWARRNKTRVAHKLSLNNATRVVKRRLYDR